jgi:fimbrial chaperone protein
MTLRSAFVRISIASLAAASIATSAAASSFQVSPINLVVPHDRPIGALTVRNGSSEPVAVRVVTYRWSQAGGEDHYEPTDDLIASPPIFTMPADGSQLIRVGLRGKPGEDEAAYRVILEEIPSAAEPTAGVRIALRLNLPFYKQPKRMGQAALRWLAYRAGDRGIALDASNSGAVHDRINRIDWIDGAGRRAPLVEKPSVVLAGNSRRWWVPNAQAAADGMIKLILVRPNGEEEQTAPVSEDRLPIRVEFGDGEEHAAVALDPR